jgi:hypothetical protein
MSSNEREVRGPDSTAPTVRTELASEDVALFRFVDDPDGCLIATHRDYEQDQTFTPIDRDADDSVAELR